MIFNKGGTKQSTQGWDGRFVFIIKCSDIIYLLELFGNN